MVVEASRMDTKTPRRRYLRRPNGQRGRNEHADIGPAVLADRWNVAGRMGDWLATQPGQAIARNNDAECRRNRGGMWFRLGRNPAASLSRSLQHQSGILSVAFPRWLSLEAAPEPISATVGHHDLKRCSCRSDTDALA